MEPEVQKWLTEEIAAGRGPTREEMYYRDLVTKDLRGLSNRITFLEIMAAANVASLLVLTVLFFVLRGKGVL